MISCQNINLYVDLLRCMCKANRKLVFLDEIAYMMYTGDSVMGFAGKTEFKACIDSAEFSCKELVDEMNRLVGTNNYMCSSENQVFGDRDFVAFRIASKSDNSTVDFMVTRFEHTAQGQYGVNVLSFESLIAENAEFCGRYLKWDNNVKLLNTDIELMIVRLRRLYGLLNMPYPYSYLGVRLALDEYYSYEYVLEQLEKFVNATDFEKRLEKELNVTVDNFLFMTGFDIVKVKQSVKELCDGMKNCLENCKYSLEV